MKTFHPRNCVAPCIELTGKDKGILLSVFSKSIFMSHPSHLFGKAHHLAPYKATPQKTGHVAMTKNDSFRHVPNTYFSAKTAYSFLTFGNDIFIVLAHTNQGIKCIKHIQEFIFYSFYILLLLLNETMVKNVLPDGDDAGSSKICSTC